MVEEREDARLGASSHNHLSRAEDTMNAENTIQCRIKGLRWTGHVPSELG